MTTPTDAAGRRCAACGGAHHIQACEEIAARLSDTYDRADGAFDLVAELRERMTTMEVALDGARALLRIIDRENPGGYAVGAVLLAIDEALGEASHAR